MATQPPVNNPKPPESHYNSQKMAFYFAMAAIFLLIAVGSLLMKDYSREWKTYQKAFRDIEIEKARVKFDKASNELIKNSDYVAVKEELEKEKKIFAANCGKLGSIKTDLAKLQTQDDLVNQNYKFKKTQADVAKFQYEVALEHHSKNLTELKTKYNNFAKELDSLKTSVEESSQAIKDKSQSITTCGEKVKELTKKEMALAKQLTILKRKIDKIDPASMSLTNQLASKVRDFPIIDLSNPNFKIEQIVLKDITEDVNFMQVPKVDRCISCHTGIANPDYKNVGQPFRTHPNLELYLGNNSAHPMEEFGCTVCHQGRGRGTDFSSAAHTPANEEEKKRWEKKYKYQEMHHWDEPMLAKQHTEATCFKCHSGQSSVKGAEKLNLGLQLIERSGCYSCHTIDKYNNWPKTGPDLTKIASKTNKEFTYRWISSPKLFRHNTWMPSYFYQSNNADPLSIIRNEQEIQSIVYYLFANSGEYQLTQPPAGDSEKGKELVSSLGCFACHQVQPEPNNSPRTKETLQQQQGPNLIGLGSKTSKEWLFNWLKDPSRYNPETKMPSLRLSDQEAADIAQYLTVDKNSKFESKQIPEVDEEIINVIANDFLSKTLTQSESKAKLSKMSLNEKLSFNGEKLITQYGCYACHNIKGFEKAKPIGTELTEEGNKSASKLDFGFIDIEHTKEAWFHQKLKDPRIFDKDKVKSSADKLIMPNFNFTDAEAEAITTALLGFVKNKSVVNKIKPRTIDNLYIEEGQKIIRQLNCQGCHAIEGEGGSVSESVKEWLIKYNNKSESEAPNFVKSFSPPTLHGLGKKVRPDWLFEFLHEPTTVRPWVKVRMPTYKFNTEHMNILIKYFTALDKEGFPYNDKVDTSLSSEEFKSAEELFSLLDCMKCHVVGEHLPTGTQDTWAPNLLVAKKKLKPGWVHEWIKNPNKYLPGTKMPAFLDTAESGPENILGGDEAKQLQLLRNYLMSISDAPAPQAAPVAPTPAPTDANQPNSAPTAK